MIIKSNMEVEIDTTTRNSIWKRLSRNISQSKLGEFARAVNRVFSSIKICRKSSEIKVPSHKSSAFVYPDDRYLCNDEILRQLEVLERRFNQQTDIFARAQGKEVHFKKAKPYHGDICPDIKPDPLPFLTATIRPARYTEEKFTELEKLVEQVKERRERLDSHVPNQH
ncbi:uncharacterized protein LOC132734593 [Ruditapes philippinarum]|uniref:uncharacterized protein LOC132734593 n=1 Tax=Ruditapes philippinarum TaxID=129788 RepID=UPI00295BB83B|nr:uncharacterized protein LOC132734593 [Ruditapes philippinarum]